MLKTIVDSLLRYFLVVVVTIIIVHISVNELFSGLHDGGAVGMVMGLMLAQLFITPVALSAKWWMKLIAALVNALIPVILVKQLALFLYSQTDDGIIYGVHVDAISYTIYFAVIILFYEMEFVLVGKRF